MTDAFILSEQSASVLTLTLNRPDVLNAFNLKMARALQEQFERAGRDDSIRAVLLTGAGRGFCAGQDLAETDVTNPNEMPDLGRTVAEQYNPLVAGIRALPKPVVCAVNGVAAGAGANLALACDIVVASNKASFIQPFARIGLVPDTGGSFFLPRLVGPARATALMMLGDKLPADRAAEWGLIWKAFEPAELMTQAMAMAQDLATQPTTAFALTKQLLNATWSNTLDEQLALELDMQRSAGGTHDFREGVLAFLEKRPAQFTGR